MILKLSVITMHMKYISFSDIVQFLGMVLALILFVVAGANAANATGVASDWVEDERIRARILVDVPTISVASSPKFLRGVLELDMPPGWHTYWRTPGDSGLAPVLDWAGSDNLKQAQIFWPVPRRFEEGGFYTYGYQDRMSLPLHITPQKYGQDIALRLKLNVLICKEICVPQQVQISLGVKMDDAKREEKSDPYVARINAAFDRVPHKGDLKSLKIKNIVVGVDKIVVSVFDMRGLAQNDNHPKPDIFVEISDGGPVMAAPAELILIPPQDSVQNKPINKKSHINIPIRDGRFIIPAPDGVENLSALISGRVIGLTLHSHSRAIEREFQF